VRNRWLVLAAALAAAVSGLLVALGTPVPAGAATGTLQAGPFGVGNLLSYANSDFEGHANFIAVTNIGTISDSSAAALHGSASLEFTAAGAGTTALKLQEGSSPTQIDVNTDGKDDTYTLGGWFKLPAANSGENVDFSLGLYDSAGNWLGWSSFNEPLALSATSNWQYVEGQITVPTNAAWALDSPKITLSNAAAGQVTYMDMLVFKPYRAAQAIGARASSCDKCAYTATDWITTDGKIGPLQSDKEFLTGDLPSAGKNPFGTTVCSGIEQMLGSTSYKKWPVCILAYKGTGMTQGDMNSFLASVPPQQEVYIVWFQEPEGKTFKGEPGCGKDTGAKAFVCEFGRQAALVHNSPDFTQNIFVADDSSGFQYGNGHVGVGCSWIVPAGTDGPDVYLEDHYENGTVTGQDVNSIPAADEWQNWLSCASAQDRPIGFGEYGLDNSPIGPKSLCGQSKSNAKNLPTALTNDNSYLEQLPMSGQSQLKNHVPVVMWDYWYSNYGGTPVCTVFTNKYRAISIWTGIETANGGT
jgi:hypothetical protein